MDQHNIENYKLLIFKHNSGNHRALPNIILELWDVHKLNSRILDSN